MELSDLPEFAHFENSFVAFIDILGFTERVREIRNEEDFQRVSRVLYILKKEAESYASANDRILAYLQMTAISDSVIISIPYRSPIAAYLMVTIVHKLQYDLLALEPLRTLIRGYIDNGPVYHRNGILFGTGYLNAYHGESASHGPPRIVVAPHIVLQAQEITEKHSGRGYKTVLEFLREGKDHVHFIDYFKPVGEPGTRTYEERLREIEDIASFAEAELTRYSSVPAIRAKYEWLTGYIAEVRQGYYEPKSSLA